MTYGGRKKIQPASDKLVKEMLKEAEMAGTYYKWEDVLALILRIKDK
jgi:hypothetical protein